MTNYIIGENIRKWRQFRGYQQAAFANKIPLSVVSLSKYENGRTDIPIKTVLKIADLLAVDIQELIHSNQGK